MFETIEELVKQRRGYKYLNKNNVSPYQSFKYDFHKKKIYKTDLNKDLREKCGEGWSLATLEWISKDTDIIDKKIIEFTIPKEAQIIVPENSRGKFRTNIIKYKKTHKIKDIFPEVHSLLERCKKYKPIKPITATALPPEKEIKRVLKKIRDSVRASVGASVRDSVRASVRASVRDSVWDSVRDSVRDSVGASVRASVWDSVGDSVWDSVGASVWDSVGDSVWDSVWDSVRDSVYIVSYYAIKEFMDSDYEHPVFDLIRMGVIIVFLNGKIKIYGKDGIFLGEYDE